jgi:hypothetical protein
LTKEKFLARCANAWDAGLIRPQTLRRLEQAADTFLRLVHCHATGDAFFGDLHQRKIAEDNARLATQSLEQNIKPAMTLANDRHGYDALQISCILSHPCQQCAVDPKAWWTRAGFCNHRKEEE